MKRSLFNRFLHPARPGAAAGFSSTLVPLLVSAFFAGPASAATSPVAPAVVPPALRPALYRAIAKDAGPAYALDKNGCATLPQSGLKACFDAKGIRFDGARHVSLHLAAFGRGTQLVPVAAVRPAIEANRVSYKHGNLTEWWRVLPMGFEQGFTIAKRPAGQGKLTLELTASRQDVGAPAIRHSREGGNPVGKSIPAAGRDTNSHWIPAFAGMTEKGNGNTLAWGKLRYGKLVVTDAEGKVVPATMTARGDRILIAVNDAHATYPLTVDPMVWVQQQKLTASDGAVNSVFGGAIAIDREAGRALIGASNGSPGGEEAVYVFTETDGVWSETAKLTGDGDGTDSFGHAVALAGGRAIVGAPLAKVGDYFDQGAAYVFTYSNGTWIQTQKLTVSNVSDDPDGVHFGASVALSYGVEGEDNYEYYVGAPFDGDFGEGAAYVFSNDGSGWSYAKLVANNREIFANFGFSVAFDYRHSLLVGAIDANTRPGGVAYGAVYKFDYSSDLQGWIQTQELTPDDTAVEQFGFSLATSPDSTEYFIGAPGYHENPVGAVYVFSPDVNGHYTQTQKLTRSVYEGRRFGVSIARDGANLVIGAFNYYAVQNGVAQKGAAYVFTETGGVWSETAKLTASDDDGYEGFGQAVAVLDASSFLVGAPGATINGNAAQGAAYFFGQGDLDLAVSAPATVAPDANYVSQAIVTNAATAVSPAVAVTVAIPAAASFVSAIASEGTCYDDPQLVHCYFGPIEGNAGTATANVTFKAIGTVGTVIANRSSVVGATPPLTASAATTISTEQAPVASDGTLIVIAGLAASGTLEASDPDGDPLTFDIVAQPNHGNATLDDVATGAYTYTPDQDYTGGDSFTFKANDGTRDSNTATIAITVDRPPEASDGTLTTDKNKAASGTLDASDPDGDTLAFSIVAQPNHGNATLDDVATGAYTYTPDQDYTGGDGFTFKASDGQADSNVATISIAVAAASSGSTVTIPTGAGPVTFTTSSGKINVGTASQPDGAPSKYDYPAGWFSFEITGLAPGDTVTVTIDLPAAIVPFAYVECLNNATCSELGAQFSGNTVTLTLTDGGAGDTDGTANGVITDPGAPAVTKASNQPPVASSGTLTTDENTAANGTLKATDADADALTFSIVAQPTHGSVTLDDAGTGAYTYTPASGYSGSDSFAFKANDGKAYSNAATISVTVNAASPPPPPHHGGGGGAFGGLGLGLLALLGLAAFIRRRR